MNFDYTEEQTLLENMVTSFVRDDYDWDTRCSIVKTEEGWKEENWKKFAELELSSLEYTELRTLAKDSAGKGPGPESSLLKIKGTDIQQMVTELAMEAVGYYANPHLGTTLSNEYVGPDYATNLSGSYFNFRKASIYGGSNEIQRNIIAKMVLGL